MNYYEIQEKVDVSTWIGLIVVNQSRRVHRVHLYRGHYRCHDGSGAVVAVDYRCGIHSDVLLSTEGLSNTVRGKNSVSVSPKHLHNATRILSRDSQSVACLVLEELI